MQSCALARFILDPWHRSPATRLVDLDGDDGVGGLVGLPRRFWGAESGPILCEIGFWLLWCSEE